MRPRIDGGETSATYMGERREAPPTANPPRKRALTNKGKVGARAVAIEVAAKRIATQTKILLRPYRSVNRPARKAPKTQPNRRELNANPKPMSFNSNLRARNGPAPV